MQEKITDAVFEQAIQWAVVLGSGNVSVSQREAFADWLQSAPAHENAWRRLQEIDGDFNVIKAAAGPAKATLARVHRGRRKSRRVVLGGLSAILLLSGAVLAGSDYRYRLTADIATGAAERRTLEIAGGGNVHINGRTYLDIEKSAQGTTLRVHKGAVVVQSGDSGTPIGVMTDQGSFLPVGTRYVVVVKGETTELSVIEGSVSASTSDESLTQRIGSDSGARVANGEIRPLPSGGVRADAWVDGVIEADDATLGAVLDGLAAHRPGWLLFDEEVSALRVSGVFRLDNTDRALTALESVLPIEIDRVTDWVVRVRLRDEK